MLDVSVSPWLSRATHSAPWKITKNAPVAMAAVKARRVFGAAL